MSDEPRRREDESDDERANGVNNASSTLGDSSASGAAAATTGAGGDDDAEAAEIAAMKARVAEMEAEAQKLREMTAAAEANTNGAAPEGDVSMSDEDREATDQRSVYVGNVSRFSLSPSSRIRLTTSFHCKPGRLQCDARRDPATLCVVRNDQPCHDPV